MRTSTIKLTERELHLLREALDSHMYWQVSEDNERDDGYVHYPKKGSEEYEAGNEEERERWNDLAEIEELIDRLDERIVLDGHKVSP